jgi:hypothetical protein
MALGFLSDLFFHIDPAIGYLHHVDVGLCRQNSGVM